MAEGRSVSAGSDLTSRSAGQLPRTVELSTMHCRYSVPFLTVGCPRTGQLQTGPYRFLFNMGRSKALVLKDACACEARCRDRGGERCRNEQPKARKPAAAGHVIANWKVLVSIIPPSGPSRGCERDGEALADGSQHRILGSLSRNTRTRINRHERMAIPDIAVLLSSP